MFSSVANSEHCNVPQHILEDEYTYGEFLEKSNQVAFYNDIKAAHDAVEKEREEVEKQRSRNNR